MPEEVKRKRGRPPKNKSPESIETNSLLTEENISTNNNFEFNSYSHNTLIESFFACGLYNYFEKKTIDNVLHHE